MENEEENRGVEDRGARMSLSVSPVIGSLVERRSRYVVLIHPPAGRSAD